MYDTLIMLKPGSTFTVDDLQQILPKGGSTGKASIERNDSRTRLTRGTAFLYLDWDDAAHVVIESNEIAEHFGIPCRDCTARFVMGGDDPEMQLFNDYLLINERLQDTGHFVIFDPQ